MPSDNPQLVETLDRAIEVIECLYDAQKRGMTDARAMHVLSTLNALRVERGRLADAE